MDSLPRHQDPTPVLDRTEFPALPRVGALLDDFPVWGYKAPSAPLGRGQIHLRTYRTPRTPGGLLCVVEGVGDGVTPSNAAADLDAALRAAYPGKALLVLEYVPPPPRPSLTQLHLAGGIPRWRHVWPGAGDPAMGEWWDANGARLPFVDAGGSP